MKRQHLFDTADKEAYDALYRYTQPGQNVYWHGFGDPPSLTFRAAFDDIAYNRERQKQHRLLKGRFQGGILGWIVEEDLELFAGLCRKPLKKLNYAQQTVLELIEREGPLNIQHIKDSTGMLVKEITPILRRLQEAFLIYEDQYDGAWDRGWYRFEEMFPTVDLNKYSRRQALAILLQRFAYRQVFFDTKRAKSFYKIPECDVKAVTADLTEKSVLVPYQGGYLLHTDAALLDVAEFDLPRSLFVMHCSDFLVKSSEHLLKAKYKDKNNDTLQYLLIDSVFAGAVLGYFKYGPYVIENMVTDRPERKEEILEAVYTVNCRDGLLIKRFNGVLA